MARFIGLIVVGALALALLLVACSDEPKPVATASPTPTATPIPAQTASPTPAATPIPAQTVLATPTATPIPAQTVLATPTATPIPAQTASPAPTATPIPAQTALPTPVTAATLVPTATPTPMQPASDRAVLVALYHSTGGASWDANTNWLSDRPIGEWYGVATNSDGRVIFLELDSNQLTGEIPAELGGLSKLTVLFLEHNELTGEIPPELGGLSNLTQLWLYANRLTGEIPPELGSLSNLTQLWLAGNELTGEIPSELGDLSNLTGLWLDENELTGEIPPELGGLFNLTDLLLGANRLTGEIPPELGGLSNLTGLFLEANRLTGCIPEGLQNIAEHDLVELNLPLCGAYPLIASPVGSPDWVFAGDVPDAERTALRAEMDAVRSWFSNQYGVEATDFTVMVGTDTEALAPEFQAVAGHSLLETYVPGGHAGPNSQMPNPFVTTAGDGSQIMVLIYGGNPFDALKEAIVHEYFHVIQYQLALNLSEVEPYWLVEGTADYADYAYNESTSGRRSFLDDNTHYEDLEIAINHQRAMTPRHLENLATESDFRSNVHPIYTYSLAFAGVQFLAGETGEDSVVEFWKLFQQRPTWQQAFEEAFGMGIEDFYDSFSEWLPDQLPSFVQFSVRLHWPGKEALPPEVLGTLNWNTVVYPEDLTDWPSGGGSWGGLTDGAHTITYSAGKSWTSSLGLSFLPDECTTHFLGWYKDGELIDQRTEATVLQFSGESSSLDWAIPARPDTLPSLREERESHCN